MRGLQVSTHWAQMDDGATSGRPTLLSIPKRSMYAIYADQLAPKTTPTERHIWQSHGVYGICFITITQTRPVWDCRTAFKMARSGEFWGVN